MKNSQPNTSTPALTKYYACRDSSRNAHRDSFSKNRKARHQTMKRVTIMFPPADLLLILQPLSNCACRDSSSKSRGEAPNQTMKRVIIFPPSDLAHLPQPPEALIVPLCLWIIYDRSSLVLLMSLIKMTKKLKTPSFPVATTTQTPSHKTFGAILPLPPLGNSKHL
jgi:hypothetical protein